MSVGKLIAECALAGVLLVVLLVGIVSYSVNGMQREQAARVPEFVWSPSPPQAFAMGAADSRSWTFSRPGKLRVKITSEIPVSFALGDPAEVQSMIEPSNGINTPRLRPRGTCVGIDSLQTEITCDVKTGDVLMVQDSRGLIEASNGVVAALFGRNTSALNAANTKSRVTVEMASWGCVRNC